MGNCLTNDSNHADHKKASLYVIGNNKYGELALGHKNTVKQLTDFNDVNPKLIINHIHNGYGHTMFIDINGNHWIAGFNDDCIVKPKEITHFEQKNIKITKICMNVAGWNTFWISNKNILYGAGPNNYYQMGLNDNNTRMKPEIIATLNNVMDIKGGLEHSMALCSSPDIMIIIRVWTNIDIPNDLCCIIKSYYSPTKYTIYSTGTCYFGQDGDGSNKINTDKWRIIDHLQYEPIIQISAGYEHSLFLDETGMVWSCGGNDNGALGVGDTRKHSSDPAKPIPFFISNKIKIKQIECGMYHNLCIDGNGQCGRRGSVLSPTLIDTLCSHTIVAIKCGAYHSYAKSQHADHFLFGRNGYNQCSLRESPFRTIDSPLCINNTFAEITNNKRINNVYLGFDNTFFIV